MVEINTTSGFCGEAKADSYFNASAAASAIFVNGKNYATLALNLTEEGVAGGKAGYICQKEGTSSIERA